MSYDPPNHARSYRRRNIDEREVIYYVIIAHEPTDSETASEELCCSVDYTTGIQGFARNSEALLRYYNEWRF